MYTAQHAPWPAAGRLLLSPPGYRSGSSDPQHTGHHLHIQPGELSLVQAAAVMQLFDVVYHHIVGLHDSQMLFFSSDGQSCLRPGSVGECEFCLIAAQSHLLL